MHYGLIDERHNLGSIKGSSPWGMVASRVIIRDSNTTGPRLVNLRRGSGVTEFHRPTVSSIESDFMKLHVVDRLSCMLREWVFGVGHGYNQVTHRSSGRRINTEGQG